MRPRSLALRGHMGEFFIGQSGRRVRRAGAGQRAGPRDSMLLMADLRSLGDPAGTPPMQIRVRNLSAGGLMAEIPSAGSCAGERVEVDLRGVGPITGIIAWAGNGRFGMSFDRQIDPKATRRPRAAACTTSHHRGRAGQAAAGADDIGPRAVAGRACGRTMKLARCPEAGAPFALRLRAR